MSIAFNAGTGANTGVITGLAVGGLPDGIVDNDMVANNTITAAKTNFTGGLGDAIINIQPFFNTTRSTVSSLAANNPNTYVDIWSFTYNKQQADSQLHTFWYMSGYAPNVSGANNTMTTARNAADTSIEEDTFSLAWIYTGVSYQCCAHGIGIFGSDTVNFPAGNTTLLCRFNNPSTGTTTAQPIQVINPNSTDEARFGTRGSRSTCIVMEVAT